MNMRRKRRSATGRTAKGKLVLILFVIIPLLGIALGYGIAKMLIIPYVTQHQEDMLEDEPRQEVYGEGAEAGGIPEPGPSEGGISPSPLEGNDGTANVPHYTFNVEGFEIYRIQVGAFSEKDNALKLAKELRDKGLAAAIDTDGMVKVYTHYLFSAEQAETVLRKVRGHYEDAYISREIYPSVNIRVRDLYASEADLLTEQLKGCREMLIEIASRDGTNGGGLKDIIKGQEERTTQFKTQIAETQWPTDLEQHKDYITNLYAAMLGSYFEYDSRYYMPGQISMELINCYIELLGQLNAIV